LLNRMANPLPAPDVRALGAHHHSMNALPPHPPCRPPRFSPRVSLAALTLALTCTLPAPAAAGQAAPIAAAAADLLSMPIEQLMQVTVVSASRYEQRASELAAAPQVIEAAQIRRFGYHTLLEILNHFGGTHVQSDGVYGRIGVRGFLQPGDYNARILLLVDGQRINEPAYDSAYLGNEALVDVALIERVEFVPGPGSSVYGSNALFGVVNVVTRKPADAPAASLALRVGDPAQAEGIASVAFDGPGGGRGYAALSGSFERGRLNDADSLGAASPDALDASGHARDTNTRFFGRYDAGSFGLTLGHVRRELRPYNGIYQSDPADPAQVNIDQLTIAGATGRWAPSDTLQIDSSLMLGRYVYRAELDYDTAPTTRYLFSDDIDARWVSLDTRAVLRWSESQVLVTGVAWQHSSAIRFIGTDVQTQERSLDKTVGLRRIGAFAQNDSRIGDDWNLSVGGRVDRDNAQRAVFSPRLGLVWRPADATVLKLQAGSAFRSPNAGEREYGTAELGYKPNNSLREERLKSTELTLEHAFSDRFTLRSTAFRYRFSGRIEVEADSTDTLIWSVNRQGATVKGLQLDLTYAGRGGWSVRGSAVRQNGSDADGEHLLYSPQTLVKAEVVWPLLPQWWLALRAEHTGHQQAPAGGFGGSTLFNTALTAGIGPSRFALTVNNLGNKTVLYPVTDEFAQPAIPGPGRSLALSWSRDF
jgi:outer membrane receptor for ferrienterochelin and colicin